jgi:hypothetical protein
MKFLFSVMLTILLSLNHITANPYLDNPDINHSTYRERFDPYRISSSYRGVPDPKIL